MAEYSVILKHWRTRLSFHNGIMSFLQPAMTSVASFAHTVVFIGLRDSEPSEGSKYARGLQEAWPVSGSNIEFRGDVCAFPNVSTCLQCRAGGRRKAGSKLRSSALLQGHIVQYIKD